MGAEVDHHLLLTSAEDHGVSKSGHARADFDGPSASVIHDTIFEAPAINVPCPAGDRTVNEGSPEEDEDHERKDSTSFGDGSSNDGGGRGAELHLVETVEQFGNQRGTGTRCAESVHQTKVLEVTNEAICGLGGEGERVTPEIPLKGDDGEGSHAGPDHTER